MLVTIAYFLYILFLANINLLFIFFSSSFFVFHICLVYIDSISLFYFYISCYSSWQFGSILFIFPSCIFMSLVGFTPYCLYLQVVYLCLLTWLLCTIYFQKSISFLDHTNCQSRLNRYMIIFLSYFSFFS